MSDPRPMRGLPQALALAGDDGRVLVAEGHEAVGWLGDLLLKSGAAVVGHETKPLVVANIAGGAAAPLPVAFDTQIAAYLLNASLRIADDCRRRPRAPRRDAAASRGRHPCRPSRPRRPGGPRLSRAAREGARRIRASTGSSVRSSCR